MANFNKAPGKAPKKSLEKYLVFICCMIGTLIWICYRASLTSKLSARFETWPFTSLQDFPQSGYKYSKSLFRKVNVNKMCIYRLNAPRRGNSLAEQFASSRTGSIYRKVYDESMDDSSFMPKKEGLAYLLAKPKQAYYILLQNALGFPEFHCKVFKKSKQ